MHTTLAKACGGAETRVWLDLGMVDDEPTPTCTEQPKGHGRASEAQITRNPDSRNARHTEWMGGASCSMAGLTTSGLVASSAPGLLIVPLGLHVRRPPSGGARWHARKRWGALCPARHCERPYTHTHEKRNVCSQAVDGNADMTCALREPVDDLEVAVLDGLQLLRRRLSAALNRWAFSRNPRVAHPHKLWRRRRRCSQWRPASWQGPCDRRKMRLNGSAVRVDLGEHMLSECLLRIGLRIATDVR